MKVSAAGLNDALQSARTSSVDPNIEIGTEIDTETGREIEIDKERDRESGGGKEGKTEVGKGIEVGSSIRNLITQISVTPTQSQSQSIASPSISHVDALLLREVAAAVLLCLTRHLDTECRVMTDIEADTYIQHVTSTYSTPSIGMAGKS